MFGHWIGGKTSFLYKMILQVHETRMHQISFMPVLLLSRTLRRREYKKKQISENISTDPCTPLYVIKLNIFAISKQKL